MIQSGEKREEYREITDYWYKRLTDAGVIKRFTDVHFTLGYPKADDTERHMTRRIADITISTGNPDWGAEPNKKYFVIKLKED